jgi:pimeloyl-ACP methyl ester carboxylesterase
LTAPIPFTVSISDAAIEDLRRRLAGTRWIDDLSDSQWRLGVSQPYLRELCDYWRTRFDWRAQEAQLNTFEQYVIEVDRQPIHFVHARSPHSDALPLLLVHGWPGSVFEYIKLFGPLADPVPGGGSPLDSFHVVAPSIPGYGFSGPTTQPGWGPNRIASAFATVMDALGYQRYGLAGGDWGAIISTELARLDGGRHVCAMHLTMPLGEPPPDGQRDVLSPDEQRGLDDWAEHQRAGTVVHVAVNSTRPHTLAFALNDSPAGLAAWLVDKYRSYSDCDGDVETAFTRDELLTEISTYWLTGTIASASRLYYERAVETHMGARCSRATFAACRGRGRSACTATSNGGPRCRRAGTFLALSNPTR